MVNSVGDGWLAIWERREQLELEEAVKVGGDN